DTSKSKVWPFKKGIELFVPSDDKNAFNTLTHLFITAIADVDLKKGEISYFFQFSTAPAYSHNKEFKVYALTIRPEGGYSNLFSGPRGGGSSVKDGNVVVTKDAWAGFSTALPQSPSVESVRYVINSVNGARVGSYFAPIWIESK